MALIVNPMNPIADISNNLGPLSAIMVKEDPIINADITNDIDIWSFKSSKPVCFKFSSSSPFSTFSIVLLSLSGKSFNKCSISTI